MKKAAEYIYNILNNEKYNGKMTYFAQNSSYKPIYEYIKGTEAGNRNFNDAYTKYIKFVEANEELANKKRKNRKRNYKRPVALCFATIDDIKKIDKIPFKCNKEGDSHLYPAYVKTKELLETIKEEGNYVEANIKINNNYWIRIPVKIGEREKNLKKDKHFTSIFNNESYVIMVYEQATPFYGYPYDNLSLPGGAIFNKNSKKDITLYEAIGDNDVENIKVTNDLKKSLHILVKKTALRELREEVLDEKRINKLYDEIIIFNMKQYEKKKDQNNKKKVGYDVDKYNPKDVHNCKHYDINHQRTYVYYYKIEF